ncbi:phage minor tail protein L [Cupriavidus nantongensis]
MATTAAAVTITDYTVGQTGIVQVAAPPAAGALLTWDGSGESIENPEADPDEQLPTELWYIEQKTSETNEGVTFELASALDFSGEQLPRRQIVANVCLWLTIGGYRGPNCGYTGTAYFDRNDNPVADPALDRCGGRLSSCKRRFGDNNPLPFGSFPAADLIRG